MDMFLFASLCLPLSVSGSSKSNFDLAEAVARREQKADVSEKEAVPASWLGMWRGELKIVNTSGKKQSLPMELRLTPLKTARGVTWHMTYDKGAKAQVRDYELRAEKEENRFVMDEKNGLL